MRAMLMLDVEIVLRNYRCFGDEPTHFRIRDGFTALVGVNNSGKSSLLRMPYELRILLTVFGQENNALVRGMRQFNSWPPTLLPGERIYRSGASRDIEFDVIIHDGPDGPFTYNGVPMILKVRLDRQNVLDTEIYAKGGAVAGSSGKQLDADIQTGALTSAIRELADSMYIGPFRNAINIGGRDKYYDITVGDIFVKTFAGYKSGPDPLQNESVDNLLRELERIFGFERLDLTAATDYLRWAQGSPISSWCS
jgi:hypothetical protein